mmetsp:Transcript_448/g.897  ORF Transcript_448/g.897 Transcript_448/m.897 type:complete len:226 (-) Transcript_448:51-728(-)
MGVYLVSIEVAEERGLGLAADGPHENIEDEGSEEGECDQEEEAGLGHLEGVGEHEDEVVAEADVEQERDVLAHLELELHRFYQEPHRVEGVLEHEGHCGEVKQLVQAEVADEEGGPHLLRLDVGHPDEGGLHNADGSDKVGWVLPELLVPDHGEHDREEADGGDGSQARKGAPDQVVLFYFALLHLVLVLVLKPVANVVAVLDVTKMLRLVRQLFVQVLLLSWIL